MAEKKKLHVDYDLLEDSKRKLKRIKSEFSEIEERRDDVNKSIGSSEVSSAMEDFVNNWDDHRKNIERGIDSILEITKKSISEFKELDSTLDKKTKNKK